MKNGGAEGIASDVNDFKLPILSYWYCGQFYRSRIEVLKIAQLLSLVIFVSVSLVRDILRGLRENLKHKVPT